MGPGFNRPTITRFLGLPYPLEDTFISPQKGGEHHRFELFAIDTQAAGGLVEIEPRYLFVSIHRQSPLWFVRTRDRGR